MCYFGAEELSALEDVLGQFIGYFCAALFAIPALEHDTEPLCMTDLQKA
jgi:hypothetical protein